MSETGSSDELVRVASPHQIELLRQAVELGTPWARKREVLATLATLPPSTAKFDYPGFYFAFTVSYLEDEHLLPEQEFGLDDGLWEVRKKISILVPTEGADLAKIDADRLDLDVMVEEFRGGGPGGDPTAADAFRQAIRVIRATLSITESGGAMVALL